MAGADQLPNLGDHPDGRNIFSSQRGKEITANLVFKLLDNMVNGVATVIVSQAGGAEIEIDRATFLGRGFIRLVPESGSPGGPEAPFALLVPGRQLDGASRQDRRLAVWNETGQDCTLATAGSPTGNTVTVPDQRIKAVHVVGEDVYEVSVGEVVAPYDVALFIPGIAAFDAILAMHTMARSLRIPAGAPDAAAFADTPPGSGEPDRVVEIRKNASGIGDVTFTALATAGVVSVPAEVDFAPGDRLVLVGPPAPSPEVEASDLADIAVTFPMTLL